MALLIVALSICCAIFLIVFISAKAALIALSIALGLIIVVGVGVLPAWLVSKLQTPYQNRISINWKNKNAIILLGNSTIKLPNTGKVEPTIMAYSGIYKAAYLYTKCKLNAANCTIIITGGDGLRTGIPEAEIYRRALIDIGIDPTDIQLEIDSLDTFKNAKHTSRLLKENKFDQNILITSGLHLKRSLLYFSFFDTQAIPVPADYMKAYYSIAYLAYNFFITDLALHEYIGIIRFYIYNFFGWNKRSVEKKFSKIS